MQQLAFLVNSGADFEAASKGTVMERGPFVDMRHDTYKVGLSKDHTEKQDVTYIIRAGIRVSSRIPESNSMIFP